MRKSWTAVASFLSCRHESYEYFFHPTLCKLIEFNIKYAVRGDSLKRWTSTLANGPVVSTTGGEKEKKGDFSCPLITHLTKNNYKHLQTLQLTERTEASGDTYIQ